MAKKAAPKAAEAKAAPAGADKKAKSRTKAEIFTKLSESSGLSKKQVSSLFDGLAELIQNDLGKKGPGVFIIPGLLKIKVQRKPATKAQRKMNPFTKQMQDYPAKPARNVVKALALKPLKEMV
ncbi:MAG: HU family DNA-binding protein [Isosphaeraceae bacterium]